MDITSTVGIASFATTLSSNKLASDVGVAVLKKALDLQAESAAQLIQSLPGSTQTLPQGSSALAIDVMA
jgi:hypothetical protein